jgi:hypothetical protein
MLDLLAAADAVKRRSEHSFAVDKPHRRRSTEQRRTGRALRLPVSALVRRTPRRRAATAERGC